MVGEQQEEAMPQCPRCSGLKGLCHTKATSELQEGNSAVQMSEMSGSFRGQRNICKMASCRLGG